MVTPLSVYRMSARAFPATAPELVYEPGDLVRLVSRGGTISLEAQRHYVGEGLIGELVGVRRTRDAGILAVYYGHHRVREIVLPATGPRGRRELRGVSHVPEHLSAMSPVYTSGVAPSRNSGSPHVPPYLQTLPCS
jgi:hypothetical protein